MANQAGDYGGSNAQANRKAALARMPIGQAGSAALNPSRTTVRRNITTARPRVSSGPTGQYSSPAPPPPAAPGPVDPNAWLGADTQYQDQLRQLALALSTFNADVTRRQGLVNTDYGTSERAMGKQKDVDLENIESDWSGRGLLRSGLYANAVGDYNEEFGQRMADLTSSKDRALAQLLQEQNAFTTQQQLDQQAAREAALRRRAAGLGTVA